MLFQGQQKVTFCICSPHRMIQKNGRTVLDTITVQWERARRALHFPANINQFEIFYDGLEIGEARSRVAADCLKHDPQPEFIYFIDDDVIQPSDALVKLFFRARTFPDYDIYSGVYCLKRDVFPEPLIYGDNGCGPIWDWAVGDILTTESHNVRSVGMGLTIIRVSSLQKLIDKGLVHGDGTDMDDEPFFKTISSYEQRNGKTYRNEGTEDIYFSDKMMKAGGKILVDTSVLGGHIDKETGIVYGLPFAVGPGKKGKWLPRPDMKESVDRTEANEEGLKLAVDLGAGDHKRSWKGYKTYTTDIRKSTNPDYVMDTRLLNFPDNHWDLVASSHHLEHLGRWDQEEVWKEIYRITKPGGRTEHIVPNIEWAARHIADGKADFHVYNVLYGAQELHGYERQFNLHYFGYTPAIARELAESVGFVEVEIEDYILKDELGYNMIIKGRKPESGIPLVSDSSGSIIDSKYISSAILAPLTEKVEVEAVAR